MLRNMRRKGAFFVEYALILSFVVLVGVAFLYNSNSSIAHNTRKIVLDTIDLVAEAAGIETNKTPSAGDNTSVAQVSLKDKTFEKGMELVVEEADPPVGAPAGTPPTLDISFSKEGHNKDVSGMSELIPLDADATYKVSMDLSSLKAKDFEDLAGSTITIQSFYKDDKGNYQYGLANPKDSNSYAQTFTFNNGSYEGLDSHTLTTGSSKDQYTYISVSYPDGDKNDNINKVTNIMKNSFTMNKQ